MNVFKKKKLIDFLENNENRMLVVWFFTLVTYIVLFFLFRNTFVLLFSYFICYLIYSRLYNYILDKIKNSFSEIDTNKD